MPAIMCVVLALPCSAAVLLSLAAAPGGSGSERHDNALLILRCALTALAMILLAVGTVAA